MESLHQIYSLLLNKFSPQGWWPITPVCCTTKETKPIYGIKTRTEKQRFEIIVGAILTQNTAWKNVEKAIENLNKNDLINPTKLKKIDKEKLGQLIKSAGYYNQKAERLKTVAGFFLKNNNPTREQLLDVNGIGPETADSILLYAYDKPFFVVDAYTKRIFERLGYKAKGYEQWQKLFMDNLPRNAELFNEYHALLVELGKNYCKKKPVCGKCPVKMVCKKEIKTFI